MRFVCVCVYPFERLRWTILCILNMLHHWYCLWWRLMFLYSSCIWKNSIRSSERFLGADSRITWHFQRVKSLICCWKCCEWLFVFCSFSLYIFFYLIFALYAFFCIVFFSHSFDSCSIPTFSVLLMHTPLSDKVFFSQKQHQQLFLSDLHIWKLQSLNRETRVTLFTLVDTGFQYTLSILISFTSKSPFNRNNILYVWLCTRLYTVSLAN